MKVSLGIWYVNAFLCAIGIAPCDLMAADIHKAVISNDLATIKRIISEDHAQLMSWDDDGFMPIHLAAEKGNIEACKILLGAGVPVDIATVFVVNGQKSDDPNLHGYTPLYLASDAGQIQMCQYLLSMGAKPSGLQGNEQIPIFAAIYKHHAEIVKLLISKGANVKAKAPSDVTPLHAAAEGRMTETVEELLKAGADVNAKTLNGDTPLIMAVAWLDPYKDYPGPASLKVCQLLIAKGAEVNASEKQEGWTALLHAARHDQIEIAKLLLSKGADPNKLYRGQSSALDVANTMGSKELQDLLKKHGAKEKAPFGME